MKCVCVIGIICCFWTVSAELSKNTNFTFTYIMAMRCKQHICQHGYTYDTFYRLDTDVRKPSSGSVLEMHLAILAASNGHILLSTTPHPEANDPVYEIVVGGGANKFSELRRNLRRNARASMKTVGILSSIDFSAFYLRISEDGDIEFGREGDDVPIFSYNDVDPIPIQYFSFASWNGVEAKFLYDCPAPGDVDGATPNSQEVEPTLSNSEKLRRILLMDRVPNLPPGPTMDVKLGVRITSLSYNALEAKLTTGLAIVSSWTDDSMAWNPSKFNGTTSLTFRQGQIWRPTFFVFNSDDMGILDTKNPELITMVNSGEATFHFQTRINTWCSLNYEVLNKWPHDEYVCSIVLGPWDAHEIMTLQQLTPRDEKMKTFAGIDEIIQNEWEIATKTATVVPAEHWNQVFSVVDNQTYQSDRFVMSLYIKRKATSYNIVFYTPLLVLVTFILMSFWSEPLQMSRVWFYTCATVVICMGLCYMDYLVPCHAVPSILILYTTVLMGVLLALLVQIILMTSVVQKFCKTTRIQTLITDKWFRIIFCLPTMKSCSNYQSVNEGYDIEEDDSGVMVTPRDSNVEEMQTDTNTYGEPVELAESVDKLLFVIYSVVFGVMLGMHY